MCSQAWASCALVPGHHEAPVNLMVLGVNEFDFVSLVRCELVACV